MGDLSKLKKITTKKAKRKGRGLGSGRGAKSGRGTTRHQKAREKIPLHFEGGQGRLVKSFPLLRGKGKNKSRSTKPLLVKLTSLNAFSDGDVVNGENLFKKGLIEDKNQFVKILNDGNLTKKLTVQVRVSAKSKKLIESAGGKVEIE